MSEDLTKTLVKCAKEKWRFESKTLIGLTFEDLFTLPLEVRNGNDLETVAQTIDAELRTSESRSFVKASSGATAKRKVLEGKLELVMHVINLKLAEKDKAKKLREAQAHQKLIREKRAELEVQKIVDGTAEDLAKRDADLQRQIDELSS